MALNERDRRALKVLGVVAPLILIFFWGGPLVKALTAGSDEYSQMSAAFAPIYDQLAKYPASEKKIRDKQEKLHVKVNSQSLDQQYVAIIKKVEEVAGQCKMKTSSIRELPAKATSKSKIAGVKKKTFLVEGKTNYIGTVKFIQGLESSMLPIVIDEIKLTAAKSKKGKGEMTASFLMHAYMFPEMKGGDKKEDDAKSKPKKDKKGKGEKKTEGEGASKKKTNDKDAENTPPESDGPTSPSARQHARLQSHLETAS